MSDFPLYLNTVAGGLDRRDQTIGGFSFVVKIYAKLILKDGELEDNWNTWVEEKMAVVQPVLDQLNK